MIRPSNFRSVPSPTRPWTRLARPAAVVVALLLSGLLAGCSTSRTDIPADERAKMIHQNLSDARIEMRRLQNSYDWEDASNAEAILGRLQEVRKLCEEALDLDINSPTASPSATPRIRVGDVFHLMGMVANRKYSSLLQRIVELENRGRSPGSDLLAERDAWRERAQSYCRQSNKHYDLYLRTIYSQFPAPIVLEGKARNHEVLGEYSAAADALERFVNEAGLRGDAKDQYMRLTRAYRERAVDVDPDGD